MESCFANPKVKVHSFCSPSFLTPIFKISSVQSLDNRKLCNLSKLRCAQSSSIPELGWNIEEQELVGMKKLKGKCNGVSGIVELLECLEKEAIMGEDQGKEPTDYNRRAQIFDKSSNVFQALKERNMASSNSCV